MSRRSTSGRLTAVRRQELEVEAALAREAVVRLHVEHALELIQHAAGRVGALRMLDIYIRVVDLNGTIEEVVANRVLAALGDVRGSVTGQPARIGESRADELLSDDDSLLRTLRRRLRGRVHDDLRRSVELRVGVVHTALLDLHIGRARGFVRLLAETHGMREAVSLYSQMVQMPIAMSTMLYVLVLGRIAAEEAPVVWPAAEVQSTREARITRRAASRGQRARTSA